MIHIKNTKKSLTLSSRHLLFHRNGGFTLFYAMLISSLLLSVGLAIFNITYKEFILTSGVRESEGAFYAADSALECALYWDFVHGGSGAPAFGFYGDSLASGLAGYWRFEETTDFDVARDSSGQGNDGDVFNDTGRTTDGYIGQSLPFNGVDTYFNAGAVNGLSFSGDNTPHTISAWVKINTLPGLPEGGKGEGTSVEWILLLGPDAEKGHGWTVDSSGVFSAGVQSGGTVVTGKIENYTGWNHVIVTYAEDGELNVYVNGTSLGAEKATGLFSSMTGVQPLTLGKTFPDGSGMFFDGELDDVRVYNRVLTADEITALFSGNSHNEFVPPVAKYIDNTEAGGIQLNCSGQIINDPNAGWNKNEKGENIGWDTVYDEGNPNYSQTTFDMSFSNNTCALVTVTKQAATEDITSTQIISRGYNTCDFNNTRRLERALKATY